MRHHVLRLLPVATVLGSLIAVAAPARPAEAVTIPFPVPGGYIIAGSNRVSAGLTHVQVTSFLPRRHINVAFLRHDANERLRVVVSNERIAGGTETVRNMCARLRCLAATNGDFYTIGTGQPTGGLASRGAPLRSSPPARYHLTQDANGATAVQQVSLTSRLLAHYADRVEPFFVGTLNTGRVPNQATLYTDVWAPTTQTGSGFEIVLEPAQAGARPQIGQSLNVRMVQGFAAGSAPIFPGRMVLSGAGNYAALLQQLWSDVLAERASPNAELTVTATPNVQTFTGGAPPLLLNGNQAFENNSSSLFASRFARTLAGVNAAGDTILVTVDAGAGRAGMTMIEAMEFMRSLGAVDALNMDGGGSATFFLRRWVANAPSDGRDRGVATALAIVASRWT